MFLIEFQNLAKGTFIFKIVGSKVLMVVSPFKARPKPVQIYLKYFLYLLKFPILAQSHVKQLRYFKNIAFFGPAASAHVALGRPKNFLVNIFFPI
jgi:hypothetical protein